MAAAMHGHVSMVELLLKHSANTELRDHTNGWTALHHAARQLQPQVVKTLIDNGAAITAVDRFGRLPLHLVYRPNNGFSDRSIVVAESGAGVRIRLGVLNANINSSLTHVFLARTRRYYTMRR